jgi:hypothetical protein
MKFTAILVSLLLTAKALSQGQDLSSISKQKILHSLNQICGDSWCAGDFEYKFQAIDCDFSSGHCAIALSVKAYDEIFFDDQGLETGRRSFGARRYACDVKGFESTASLLDSAQLQYSNALYEALSACITDSIAPVQNAIRFAWPLKDHWTKWNLTRVVRCPMEEEATRPLASEYAFTAAEISDFALIAALDRSGLDAAAHPSCALESYQVTPDSIRCVAGGVPAFCEVALRDGVYLVSKDYVDSVLVTFEAKSESVRVLPKVFSRNDAKTLYLPDPGRCSADLLAGYTQEASVDWTNLSAGADKADLRFVVAGILRERVKGLSIAALDQSTCAYVEVEMPAASMHCEALTEGQLCTLKAEQGGYWRVFLSENGRVSTFFHRYD